MEKLDILSERIKKFVSDRDWEKFHTPSNLAKSICLEAAELLECFQWDNENYDQEHVLEELADVMNYCIQMSQVLGVDIVDIIHKKLDKTEKNTRLIKQKVFQQNMINYKGRKLLWQQNFQKQLF